MLYLELPLGKHFSVLSSSVKIKQRALVLFIKRNIKPDHMQFMLGSFNLNGEILD